MVCSQKSTFATQSVETEVCVCAPVGGQSPVMEINVWPLEPPSSRPALSAGQQLLDLYAKWRKWFSRRWNISSLPLCCLWSRRLIKGHAGAAVWDLGQSLHDLEKDLRNVLISMLSWVSVGGPHTSIYKEEEKSLPAHPFTPAGPSMMVASWPFLFNISEVACNVADLLRHIHLPPHAKISAKWDLKASFHPRGYKGFIFTALYWTRIALLIMMSGCCTQVPKMELLEWPLEAGSEAGQSP